MITRVLGAVVVDIVEALDESFFDLKLKQRQDHLEAKLGKTYPERLMSWAREVGGEDFVEEISFLTELFAADESILSSRKEMKKISLLEALAAALEDGLLYERHQKQTALKEVLESYRKEENPVAFRALEREAGRLIEMTTGKIAPEVQVAHELDAGEEAEIRSEIQKTFGGLPAIKVNSYLLGGMRVFKGSELHDRSWRAKLDSFFGALR